MAVLSLLGPEVAAAPAILGVARRRRHCRGALRRGPAAGGGFVRRMPWPTVDSFDLLIPRERTRRWWTVLTVRRRTPRRVRGRSRRCAWSQRCDRASASTPTTAPSRTRCGWIGGPAEHGAVHLDKGCYRGQETVARVHNLGKPPRHLVLLHLDGSRRRTPRDRRCRHGRRAARSGGRHRRRPFRTRSRSRWRWSSAPCPSDTPLVAGPCAASIDPDSIPQDDDRAGRTGRPSTGCAAGDRRPGRGGVRRARRSATPDAARPGDRHRQTARRRAAVARRRRRVSPAIDVCDTAIPRRPVQGGLRVRRRRGRSAGRPNSAATFPPGGSARTSA